MTDLDKARVWAECTAGLAHLKSEEIQAAVDVIQSLPDRWVDAEKVREIIEEMENLPATTGVASEIAIATEAWKRRLEALVPPKLPTLADMTQEEREACQWMQAKIYDDGFIGILTEFSEVKQTASYLCPGGETSSREYSVITPLPDLPKLKWPGSESLVDVKKLSTQQDYREAPVGAVVQYPIKGAAIWIKTRDLNWRNIDYGKSYTSFQMSGDIREIVTVIEVK